MSEKELSANVAPPIAKKTLSNLSQAALYYATQGWYVLPLRPRSKIPLTPHGLNDASSDPMVVFDWWQRWPNANIGIACGPTGLLVLDVDPRYDGDNSLRELEKKYGALPETIESLTGGGGRHIFFHSPKEQRGKQLAEGIDIKAGGGYVVVPPSIHPTGHPYVWEIAHLPEEQTLATPPDWLLTLLAATEGEKSKRTNKGHILTGQRNSTLISLAGVMRHRGMTVSAIEAALLIENNSRCQPPLPEDEVREIARSIGRYTPNWYSDNTLQKDYGHAVVLADQFKHRYRWADHRESWMMWTGAVWRPVPEELVAKRASDELQQYYATLLVSVTDKNDIDELNRKISDVCFYSHIISALSFLKGWQDVWTTATEWDCDQWLLNVNNGILDLQNYTLRAHDPSELITKLAPIDFNPTAPEEQWQQHITRFLPNANIRRQVQRDLGCSLPGVALEENLVIWYGIGANGKTTTARTLLRVLGDYADRAAPNLLIQNKYDRHPTELAALCGLRLVFSVEIEQGKRLAEALVKDLTGGDRKKARFMRQDFFSFEQTFSIVLIANYKPIVAGTDEGIWRRLRLIPWEHRIHDHEKQPQEIVISRLLNESSAILNWLLEGLIDWQQDHTWIAPEVQAANEAYRIEMDILSDFLTECCVLSVRSRISKAELYSAYEEWCKTTQERIISKREFTRLLAAKGVSQQRVGDKNVSIYEGVRLRAASDQDAPNETKIF